MSNQEFENYIALMGKLLQLSPEQRDQISGELQDHLQMRVADLMSEGVFQPEAVRQALDEFGDAAVMAKNFQTVLNHKRRRWMMRFATFSIAGAFLAAILTMALWPDNAKFGGPNVSVAQNQEQEGLPNDASKSLGLSAGTINTRIAEEKLKEVVSLAFDQAPYSDVQAQLKQMTGLNFLLSQSAMDDSLSEDDLITFELVDMPLGKALSLMLVPYNATYVIDSGVVIVISLDDAGDTRWFRLKMYDCKELVEALPKTASSFGGGGGGFSGGGFGGGGRGSGGSGGGGGVFSIQSAPVQQEQGNTTVEDATKLLDQKLEKLLALVKAQAKKNRPAPSSEETLRDLVLSMISPDSWQDTGQGLGQVKVVNGILIVSQTEEIHGQIEVFLKDLESHTLKGKKN